MCFKTEEVEEGDTDMMGRLEALKGILRDYWEEQARNFALQAGAVRAACDECPSSYFFKSVRPRQARAVLSSLRVGAREVVELDDLLEAAAGFYQLLFQARGQLGPESEELLAAIDRRLGASDQALLDGALTLEELEAAM